MYKRKLSPRYPTDLPAWRELKQHYKTSGKKIDMRQMFRRDAGRAERFSIKAGNLHLDYSRNLINTTTMRLLIKLTRQAGVSDLRDAMFAGEHINESEDRAVLHVALRARRSDRFRDGQQNVTRDVLAVRERMEVFVSAVHRGSIAGVFDQRFTDVVNIGIGGSDLGNEMTVAALKHCAAKRPRVHFVSNVDGTQLEDLKNQLDPATTLFVICSKTFTTQETMTNAVAARQWVVGKLGAAAVCKHFVAASTNHVAMDKFGINPDFRFGFWDWVGGRYSLWSAVGISIALAIGWKNFASMLDGARTIDKHFAKAPLAENMPILLAVLSVWYNAFFDAGTQAILPYDSRLARFPAFLQQLQMESNGKSVRVDGKPVVVNTGQIIWGEAGNNAQHSFYQLLHQGTRLVPIDFLAPVRSSGGRQSQQNLALANCLAQSQALMYGRAAQELKEVEDSVARSDQDDASLGLHRQYVGNRPSNILMFESSDPATLGQLVALYEHKVFVEGALYGINSFDQWGVELGKELSKKTETAIKSSISPSDADSATRQALALIAKWQR